MEDTRHLGMLSLIYPLSKTFELGLDLYGIKQLRSYQDPDFYLGLVDDSHDNKTGGWDLEIHQTNKWKKIKIDTVSGYNLRYDHLISTGLLTAEEASKESGRISRLSHNGYSRADFHFFLNTPSKGLEQKGGVQGRLVLSPALRLESSKLSYGQRQVQQPQDAFSYSLGWRVAIDRQNLVVIKGNAGTAFRNPTFNDLFWPATSFALGNPQLKPERMFIFDTGVNIKPFPFISLEAVGFLHQARDLIQWNPGAAGLWQPQNIGKARIWGLELEAALLLEIPWLQGFGEVKVNYSFLAAQDKTEGTPSYNRQLPRRAKEKFNLLINYTNYQGHSLNLNGRYVGHRYITAQNTKYLDPYLVVDGTCTFYLKEKIYLIFTVKNLLGTRYVDIREFPVPGREGGIKLGVQF